MAKKKNFTNISSVELHNLDTILRGINFLAQFSLTELEKLITRLQKVSFKKGKTVVKEGEPGDSFYFISEGSVGVWVKKGLGKSLIRHLGSGEYFGEMALLTGGRRTATIIVEEDAEFFTLSKDTFREILLENPSLMDMIMRTSEKRKTELMMERGD